MGNMKKPDFYNVCSYTQLWQAATNKSNVHHLYVKEGQVCNSVKSKDDNEKVKQFITFSVTYILDVVIMA